MPFSDLNGTQESQVLGLIFESTATSVAPLLLLESFMMGALCACVPLVSYLLWAKPHSFPLAPFISTLWIVLIVTVAHWAFSLRQLEFPLTGCLLHEILMADVSADVIANWGRVWQLFLPLVTETVLFGFASFLFSTTVYVCFWPMRSRWRSCFPSIIPAMASLMYILSLTHWTVSLRFFTLRTIMINDYLEFPLPLYALDVVILTLLSLNVVMSDAVVLWRMCVVWERARPAVALATVLMITTIGVNIANIVLSTRTQLSEFGSGRLYVPPGENKKDTEDISIYGLDSVGLAAAFVSLASNSCATILVGTKAFLHRRLLSKYLRCGTGRTLAQRVMELLAESGVIYTAIWLLYCVSFLRPFATYDIFAFRNLGLSPLLLIYVVTAVSHLDAAMAQITSIYPLMVFSLVALDKLHHSRGPWTLHRDAYQPEEGNQAVTVTFEIDVERSSAQPSTPARPMIALREGDGDQYAMDETKPRATAV